MARLLANRDGGTSNEYGTFAALGRLLTGDVIEGFQVVPNGTPNMTVLVNPGSGRITTGTYPSSYSYFVSHDTVGGESVTIATAAASPRIDYIVGYVDKSVTPSPLSANVNNTNGVFKFASVAGTPAGSPLVPTVGQIQTAIGAANPYIILAQVAVGASVTTITTPNLSDMRSMISLPGIKTIDANGWNVFNFGSYKVYESVFTWTGSINIAANGFADLPSYNLPVGVPSISSTALIIITGSANVRDLITTTTVNTGSTSIDIHVANIYNGGAETLTRVRTSIRITV
jgi:hypothetical protein